MPVRNLSVNALLRPELFELATYKVADATGCVKLDAMENPYSWPPDMVAAWLDKLQYCQPNRYPDPSALALKRAIINCNNIPPKIEVLLGNGSDEIIQIILMAIAGIDVTVVSPEPSFVMYRQIASVLGLKYIGVPLKPDSFQLDMDIMTEVLATEKPAVIFLAYPNNPTGNLFNQQDVLEILRIAPGLVVIDEAYAPFAEASFMDYLPRFDNLLVMRTVSKLGLAGLRLGFLAGGKAWLEQLDKIRLPYNINTLTQVSAEFALENFSVFERQTRSIREDRAKLFAELSRDSRISVYPSQANFLLFRVDGFDGTKIFSVLKENGVLIKDMNPVGGLVKNCLRVTVGTATENQQFISEISKALAVSSR